MASAALAQLMGKEPQAPDVPAQLATPDPTASLLQNGSGRPLTETNHIKVIRYEHDAMIDLLVANPDISQNLLAAHFGYSAAWISRIMCSDAFQERLQQRKKDLIDPEIVASIELRFKALARDSLDKLLAKVNGPNPSDDVLLKSADLARRALGYGAKEGPQTNVQVNVQSVVHVPAKIESSTDWEKTHAR